MHTRHKAQSGGIVGLALIVTLAVAACGDDSQSSPAGESTSTITATTLEPEATTIGPPSSTTTTEPDDGTIRISVTVGVDAGPQRIEEVEIGRIVELTMLNPDSSDEFHVHGFDLGGDETPAGVEKVFVFTPTEAGDFEVESHSTGDVLVVIRAS